jgi:hypothetical protein
VYIFNDSIGVGRIRLAPLRRSEGHLKAIICSVQSQDAALSLVDRSKIYCLVHIDDAGACQQSSQPGSIGAIVYAGIQYTGVAEPRSGNPGLVIMPGCVVYNGGRETFLDAFSHYRANVPLQAHSAIYISADSAIHVDDDRITVRTGYLSLMRLAAGKDRKNEFEILQFGSGESLTLSARAGDKSNVVPAQESPTRPSAR